MKNFIYESKTKILFGKDQIELLKEELKNQNVKTMLFVYGKSAIKQLGIYDKIIKISQELNITVIEESGVQPNPDVSSVRSGIIKCKEHKVDFVLAAGGGSVADCAKAIAFGVFYDGDVWDIYLREADSFKSLPLGVVITLAATGTETNGNSVISNSETNEKRSVGYPISVPKFTIIDPSYTLSVNNHHTFAGSIDIIMHILEQFFSNTKHTTTSDYMSIGVIKSVIENTNKILIGEDSYDVRSNISWASTIGLNWILGIDKIGDWATHRLSYVITKEYGVTHGYALAMIYSSWARIAFKYNSETMERRLNILGNELFSGLQGVEVLNKLDDIFESWGAKVRIIDLKIDENKMNLLVENALALGNLGTVTEIDKHKAIEIFENANTARYVL